MSSPNKPIAAHPTRNDAAGEPASHGYTAGSGPETVFTIDLEAETGGAIVRCKGRWSVHVAERLRQRVDVVARQCPAGDVRIDLSGLEVLDTAGALVVRRLQRLLAASGRAVELTAVPPKPASVLATVTDAVGPPVDVREGAREESKSRERSGDPIGARVVRLADTVGRSVFDLVGEARGLVGFLGLTVVRFFWLLLRPRRLRFTSIAFHAEQTGLNAVPIVCLLSFLVGIVIAYQGAVQLRQFGADLFVVNLIGISVLRELGILVTAIILAGRSGSAFTAQIGTMKVNQEIDAMSTIGLDPVETLVLPRLIALLITMPLLTFLANLAGIGGGALMAYVVLDVDFGTFVRQFRSDVDIGHLWVGLVKAPVFAFAIAMVGCYQGLRVTGSAESVGILTTKSVVQSIFLVIVLDAIFSIVLSNWGF
jgi:phospholipid/cholesterol/gamma-HCH transport system permease protein